VEDARKTFSWGGRPRPPPPVAQASSLWPRRQDAGATKNLQETCSWPLAT